MNITLTITATPALLEAMQNIAKVFTPQQVTTFTNGHSNGAAKKENANGTTETKTDNTETKTNTAETKTDDAPVKETVTAPKEPVSIEQVRAAVQAKAAAGKREAIKSTLAEFSADKVTALKTSQYADFLTKVEAL